MKYNYFAERHFSLPGVERESQGSQRGSLSYSQTAARRDGWTCLLDKDTRQSTRDESDGDRRRREARGGREEERERENCRCDGINLFPPLLSDQPGGETGRGKESHKIG